MISQEYKEELKNEMDSGFRESLNDKIYEEVVDPSRKGEIGLAGYIEGLENVLKEAKEGLEYWPE